MSQSTPPTSLSDDLASVRALAGELPGPDLDARAGAEERLSALAASGLGLGQLGDLATWLATWQGRRQPDMRRPRVSLFAANHGVAAARRLSLDPAAETAALVKSFVEGGHPLNRLCETVDCDLRVYELDLDSATADFADKPAMDEEEFSRALAYGLMAAEPGVSVLCLGGVAVGARASAAALAAAVYGDDPAEWLDAAPGAEAAALAARAGLARLGPCHDGLELLRQLGGLEMAAIAGAIMAARLARIPAIVDGFATLAAAAALTKLHPRILDHVLVPTTTGEAGYARLATRLGKKPAFDFAAPAGCGVGAALALPTLKAVCAFLAEE